MQDSIRSVRHNKIQTGLRSLNATALKVCIFLIAHVNPYPCSTGVEKQKKILLSSLHASLPYFFVQGVKLNNLTAMEVNIIRPFMSSALDHILESRSGGGAS